MRKDHAIKKNYPAIAVMRMSGKKQVTALGTQLAWRVMKLWMKSAGRTLNNYQVSEGSPKTRIKFFQKIPIRKQGENCLVARGSKRNGQLHPANLLQACLPGSLQVQRQKYNTYWGFDVGKLFTVFFC